MEYDRKTMIIMTICLIIGFICLATGIITSEIKIRQYEEMYGDSNN